MLETLAFILIVLPFLAALGCFAVRASAVRSLIIVATSALLVVAFILLIFEAPATFSPEAVFGLPVREVIQVADFLLLGVILYFGVVRKSALIVLFALIQLGLSAYLEFGLSTHQYGHPPFVVDNLALVMVSIITVVGGAIAVHAIPYMKEHEHHLHLEKSRQPTFFFVLVLFLGAMNGLALTNDIAFFYFSGKSPRCARSC
jgi:ech hydrogenase subunit A